MTLPVLWHSNAPWACSGYGQQTKLFAPRIRDLGADVAISAYFGVQGSVLGYQGMKVYPSTGTSYGADILTPHALHHFKNPTQGVEREPCAELRDGLIITLMDVWVLDPMLFEKCNAACWVPIDHNPAPPRVVEFFRSAPHVVPIAMSEFGRRELEQQLPGREVLYVPHGVDTQAFEPLDDEGRSEARTAFGVDDEDRFIVGVVAANQGYPSRKALPELIDAFGRFLRTEEGKGALLYLHTERTGRYQGVNLEPIIAAARIPRENVRFAAQYEYLTGGFGADYMARAYNAMDVLLNPAMGEGFGVPIIEAQACGTPVIVGENTAQVEIGKVGWHVGGQRIWTAQDSWQTVPDVEQMVGALRMARSMSYRKRGAAREHALQYDVDHVTRTYWRPALERLAEMVEQSRMARSFLIPSAPVSS